MSLGVTSTTSSLFIAVGVGEIHVNDKDVSIYQLLADILHGAAVLILSRWTCALVGVRGIQVALN